MNGKQLILSCILPESFKQILRERGEVNSFCILEVSGLRSSLLICGTLTGLLQLEDGRLEISSSYVGRDECGIRADF